MFGCWVDVARIGKIGREEVWWGIVRGWFCVEEVTAQGPAEVFVEMDTDETRAADDEMGSRR